MDDHDDGFGGWRYCAWCGGPMHEPLTRVYCHEECLAAVRRARRQHAGRVTVSHDEGE